jgi:hypothetical protein
MKPLPDKQSDRRRTMLVVCAILLIALPVIYFLSVGPALWLTNRGYISEAHFKTAYAPLLWAREWKPFGEVLQRYVWLWRYGTTDP